MTMEQKTRIDAADGKQDLTITRDFDLPVDLLFRAYTDAEIVEQWMGTKVLSLDPARHGAYHFQTRDGGGNILFEAHGVIHDTLPDQSIVRTFEMKNSTLPPQLEFIGFEKLDEDRSRLTMHIVYRSARDRENQLRMPFAYGINMAHDSLQEIVSKIR